MLTLCNIYLCFLSSITYLFTLFMVSVPPDSLKCSYLKALWQEEEKGVYTHTTLKGISRMYPISLSPILYSEMICQYLRTCFQLYHPKIACVSRSADIFKTLHTCLKPSLPQNLIRRYWPASNKHLCLKKSSWFSDTWQTTIQLCEEFITKTTLKKNNLPAYRNLLRGLDIGPTHEWVVIFPTFQNQKSKGLKASKVLNICY